MSCDSLKKHYGTSAPQSKAQDEVQKPSGVGAVPSTLSLIMACNEIMVGPHNEPSVGAHCA